MEEADLTYVQKLSVSSLSFEDELYVFGGEMFPKGWRENTWATIGQDWDVIIIGGGITGAGILRLASAAGYKTILLEANDFASGTSSRSSKLVHGGLRYLYNRQFSVTRESVHEREWLLKEAPGLVNPLPFLLPNYSAYHKSSWEFLLGVTIYDLMVPKWGHRHLSSNQLIHKCPTIQKAGLLGGCEYGDASVDDSRLVMRVLEQAIGAGGTALNYARVVRLITNKQGMACGVTVKDTANSTGASYDIGARVIVNASGPWTDDLRGMIGENERIRKQRGSHILFPYKRIPINHAVTLFHPRDSRALFAIPWEGMTMIGTTDIDHEPRNYEWHGEPFASEEEIEYLLEASRRYFPAQNLEKTDITSTFAGVRPVVRTGAATPSKESRAHALWEECGMLTITGGKLTTFRIMTNQVMDRLTDYLPGRRVPDGTRMVSSTGDISLDGSIDPRGRHTLVGRYGNAAAALLYSSSKEELQSIGDTSYFWAELRWAARRGGVVHLDDLLLRRLRLGLICPEGGQLFLERVGGICQEELGWGYERLEFEKVRYLQIWSAAYSPTPGEPSIEVPELYK